MLSTPPAQFTSKRLWLDLPEDAWVEVPENRVGRYWRTAPVAIHLEGTKRVLLGEVLDVRVMERKMLVRIHRVVNLPDPVA